MKKAISLLVLLAMMAAAVCGCAQTAAQRTIVTSFYPMYVFALNVTKGIEGVQVVNMADQNVGCLHDYQLQTRDMVTLDGADVLIVNGGGMEQFLGKVTQTYAGLPVIDASQGVAMKESAHSHAHDHADHDHEHGETCVLNAHVWLNPQLAKEQVQNIAEGLASIDAQNAQAYLDNAQTYCARIDALDNEIAEQLAPFAGAKVVSFHEAFAYFADAYGIEIVGLIEQDDGEEPGTRELARTCDLVREQGVAALFTEAQYPNKSADTIARETGAKVYSLDTVVSGDGAEDSYERAMRANAQTLTEALAQ